MIIFQKFCYFVPLRLGCIFVGYFLIIQGFVEVYIMMSFMDYCARLKKLWFLHDQANIISGILLLASSHNPENLTFLLPIHIVVKLVALIIELTFYMLLASADKLDHILVTFSFCSIMVTVYCLLVIYSFFQKSNEQV